MTRKWTRSIVVALVMIAVGVGLDLFESWAFDRGRDAALADDNARLRETL